MLDRAANTIHVLGAVVALAREEREDESGSVVTAFRTDEIARVSGVGGGELGRALEWLLSRGDISRRNVNGANYWRLLAKGLDAYRTLEAFDAVPARR